MGRKRIANTAADATLPKTPVTIGGKTYNLCLDLGALAEAETAINSELQRAGRNDFVNLLYALPVQNLANTRDVFAAAMRPFHPEISFDEAKALITVNDLWVVADAVAKAYRESAPDLPTAPREPQA